MADTCGPFFPSLRVIINHFSGRFAGSNYTNDLLWLHRRHVNLSSRVRRRAAPVRLRRGFRLGIDSSGTARRSGNGRRIGWGLRTRHASRQPRHRMSGQADATLAADVAARQRGPTDGATTASGGIPIRQASRPTTAADSGSAGDSVHDTRAGSRRYTNTADEPAPIRDRGKLFVPCTNGKAAPISESGCRTPKTEWTRHVRQAQCRLRASLQEEETNGGLPPGHIGAASWRVRPQLQWPRGSAALRTGEDPAHMRRQLLPTARSGRDTFGKLSAGSARPSKNGFSAGYPAHAAWAGHPALQKEGGRVSDRGGARPSKSQFRTRAFGDDNGAGLWYRSGPINP
jgi:hypothetical protein